MVSRASKRYFYPTNFVLLSAILGAVLFFAFGDLDVEGAYLLRYSDGRVAATARQRPIASRLGIKSDRRGGPWPR
jgi:hypothetical protein